MGVTGFQLSQLRIPKISACCTIFITDDYLYFIPIFTFYQYSIIYRKVPSFNIYGLCFLTGEKLVVTGSIVENYLKFK